MQQHIGKLLPADRYQLQLDQPFTTLHVQSLFQLYQPIIGTVPISLFLTLVSQPANDRVQTHHLLMQNMNMPLTDIYQARLMCEAIGLIRTFKYEDEEETLFTYQLALPCTPSDFFENGMLSQLLYHQLSQEKFDRLKGFFIKSVQKDPIKGKNVSANYSEVFHKEQRITDQTLIEMNKTNENTGPSLGNETVDWSMVTQIFAQRMLPTANILTAPNMKLIEQMSVLYQLTSAELEKAIMWALTNENVLNTDEFKAACLDLSQNLSSSTKLSEQVINQKEKISQAHTKEPKSKQDQFIETMQTISPKELLEDLSNGNQASSQDLKMIADVMDKQGIPPTVMNVLIHYVMLKTDMKLTKSYLEKIASHWARKNVKTAHQAMTLAKAEHKKYQEWGNNSKPYYKQTGKKEVVPDWFKEQKKVQAKKEKKNASNSPTAKEDVSEMLRKFNEQKSNDR